jgi:hypothetical protein
VNGSSLKSPERDRPIGVWILSGLAIILGLVTFIQIFTGWMTGENSLADVLTTLEMIDLIGGLGLVIASIGAWLGYNRARLLLMAFVFLFAFDLAVTVLDDISSQMTGSTLSDRGQGSQLILVLPPILLVVIYLWYFNRAPVKAYYLPVEPEN